MKKLLIIILLFFPSNAFSIDEPRVGMSEKELSSLCNRNFTITSEGSYGKLIVRNYSCKLKTKEGESKSFDLRLENKS